MELTREQILMFQALGWDAEGILAHDDTLTLNMVNGRYQLYLNNIRITYSCFKQLVIHEYLDTGQYITRVDIGTDDYGKYDPVPIYVSITDPYKCINVKVPTDSRNIFDIARMFKTDYNGIFIDLFECMWVTGRITEKMLSHQR